MNESYFELVLYPEKLDALFAELIETFPKEEELLLKKARLFAGEKHKHQKRDEGTPYISHCVLAALLAHQHGGTVQDMIVLLLHDTLEDTETSLSELQKEFGEEISQKVLVLSHSVDGVRLSGEAYLAQLVAHPECLFLKGCDRIANLYSTYVQPKRSKKVRMIHTTEQIVYPLLKEHPLLISHLEDIIRYIKAHPILPKTFKQRIQLLSSQ